MILESLITNTDNPWLHSKGGNTTTDKVFLLSIGEVVDYFGDSGDLAKHKGWSFSGGKYELCGRQGYYINDQYNDKRVAKFKGQACWWWLRSPGLQNCIASNVYEDGSLRLSGIFNYHVEGGVRPALWIKL